MKKSLLIGSTIVGSSILAGTGIGLYFVFKKDAPKELRIQYEINSEESNLQIEHSSSLMSQSTISLFSKMIESNDYVGPEQGLLKKIILNQVGQNDAVYNTKSEELFINTKKIKDKYNFKNDFDNAYYMYQLFVHEYLHHVANTYLNNVQDANNKTNDIHSIYETRKEENWPSSFITSFKTDLNYNNNTKLYSPNEVKPGFVSLGSIYNQKDLFELANGSTKSLYPKLNGKKPVMAPLNPQARIDNHHIIKSGSLEYLYSMSELFARKYSLLEQTYTPTLNTTGNDGNGFNLKGFINHKGKQTPSDYLEDTFNFKRSLTSNDGEYLHDNPFTKRKELEELRSNMLGKESNSINFISFKNDKHYDMTSVTGVIDKTKLKLGGNIFVKIYDKDGQINIGNIAMPKQKYIGYMLNGKFVPTKIIVKRKIQVIESTNIHSKVILRDYFYTNGYMNVDDMKDKELFLSEDITGTTKTKLTNINTTSYNGITTFSKYDATKHDYKVVVDNGSTKLKQI